MAALFLDEEHSSALDSSFLYSSSAQESVRFSGLFKLDMLPGNYLLVQHSSTVEAAEIAQVGGS